MQNRSQDRSLARAGGKFHASTNGKEEEIATDGDSASAAAGMGEEEEAEFNWAEYMEESGASAASHTAFKHVETSLRSSFQPGMKLEVANRGVVGTAGGTAAATDTTYWVATIVTTCGQLLLLHNLYLRK
ncbi:hypothetical protein CRUP_023130, partial [Coryphaenoides rupestris]